MKQHTPAPWLINKNNCDNIMDKNGYAIADIARAYSSIDDDEEHQANARLISAAPELLDALEGIRKDCIDPFVTADDIRASINKWSLPAIAKARGE